MANKKIKPKSQLIVSPQLKDAYASLYITKLKELAILNELVVNKKEAEEKFQDIDKIVGEKKFIFIDWHLITKFPFTKIKNLAELNWIILTDNSTDFNSFTNILKSIHKTHIGQLNFSFINIHKQDKQAIESLLEILILPDENVEKMVIPLKHQHVYGEKVQNEEELDNCFTEFQKSIDKKYPHLDKRYPDLCTKITNLMQISFSQAQANQKKHSVMDFQFSCGLERIQFTTFFSKENIATDSISSIIDPQKHYWCDSDSIIVTDFAKNNLLELRIVLSIKESKKSKFVPSTIYTYSGKIIDEPDLLKFGTPDAFQQISFVNTTDTQNELALKVDNSQTAKTKTQQNNSPEFIINESELTSQNKINTLNESQLKEMVQKQSTLIEELNQQIDRQNTKYKTTINNIKTELRNESAELNKVSRKADSAKIRARYYKTMVEELRKTSDYIDNTETKKFEKQKELLLKSFNNERSNTKKKFEKKLKEVELKEEKLHEVRTELDILKDKEKDLETQIVESEKKIKRYESNSISSSKNELVKSEKKVLDLQERLDQNTNDIKNMASKELQQKIELSRMKRELSKALQLQQTMKLDSFKVKKNEKEKKALQIKKDQIESQSKQKIEKLTEKEQKLTQRVKNIAHNLKETEINYKDIQSQKERTEQSLHFTQNKLNDTVTERNKLKEHIKNLEVELNVYKKDKLRSKELLIEKNHLDEKLKEANKKLINLKESEQELSIKTKKLEIKIELNQQELNGETETIRIETQEKILQLTKEQLGQVRNKIIQLKKATENSKQLLKEQLIKKNPNISPEQIKKQLSLDPKLSKAKLTSNKLKQHEFQLLQEANELTNEIEYTKNMLAKEFKNQRKIVDKRKLVDILEQKLLNAEKELAEKDIECIRLRDKMLQAQRLARKKTKLDIATTSTNIKQKNEEQTELKSLITSLQKSEAESLKNIKKLNHQLEMAKYNAQETRLMADKRISFFESQLEESKVREKALLSKVTRLIEKLENKKAS